MNREFWNKRKFTNKNPLDYNCPKCKIGILNINIQHVMYNKDGDILKIIYIIFSSFVFEIRL